jgi:hypothetical protein
MDFELIDLYIELKMADYTLSEMPTHQNNFNVYLGLGRVVNCSGETSCGIKMRLVDLNDNILIRPKLGYHKKYKIFRTIDEIFNELFFLVSKW